MADALCIEYPELVFVPGSPGRSGAPPNAVEEAALAVCRRCPVVDECRAFRHRNAGDRLWARVDLPEDLGRSASTPANELGVWGGTTEHQCREMRRAA